MVGFVVDSHICSDLNFENLGFLMDGHKYIMCLEHVCALDLVQRHAAVEVASVWGLVYPDGFQLFM